MHPQETNWNEPHVHKQQRYFNKANQYYEFDIKKKKSIKKWLLYKKINFFFSF